VGDNEWRKGVSNDLSNHGLSFEGGQRLSLGDEVEIVIVSTVQAAGTTLDIRLKGRVASVLRNKGRTGVVLAGFFTEDDENRYTYLIHQPEELLRHEPLSAET
jgi:hypothetical protein